MFFEENQLCVWTKLSKSISLNQIVEVNFQKTVIIFLYFL